MGEYTVKVDEQCYEVHSTTPMSSRYGIYSMNVPKKIVEEANGAPLLVSPSPELVLAGLWFPTFVVPAPYPETFEMKLLSTVMGLDTKIPAQFHLATIVIL